MTFCQNCGSAVDGRFCAKCGAAVGQESGQPTGPSTAPPGPGASGMTDNVAGAIAYIPIVGIIFLLIEPYNRNKAIRFHAFQGLFLLGVSIVIHIVMGALIAMLWGLVFLMPLVNLAFIGLWLFMMFKTYSGDRIVLPIIGPLAEKQA
jgi:uncharacterized membrane protein